MYRPAHHAIHAYTISLDKIDILPCLDEKRLANNAILNELIAKYLGRYRGQIFQFEMVHAVHPLKGNGSRLRGFCCSTCRCPSH